MGFLPTVWRHAVKWPGGFKWPAVCGLVCECLPRQGRESHPPFVVLHLALLGLGVRITSLFFVSVSWRMTGAEWWGFYYLWDDWPIGCQHLDLVYGPFFCPTWSRIPPTHVNTGSACKHHRYRAETQFKPPNTRGHHPSSFHWGIFYAIFLEWTYVHTCKLISGQIAWAIIF